MITKHTGGTWRAAAKPTSIVGWPIISAPQGKSVANVHGIDEESAANARLIAAAPDLLEVCQRFMEFVKSGERFSYPSGSLQQLEAAIAKATRAPQ